VIEPQELKGDDRLVYQQLQEVSKPVILAINKVDKLKDKRELLPLIDRLRAKFDFAAIVPISALKGVQLEALEEEIKKHLPEGPMLYSEGQVTDKTERFQAAEIVREKLIHLLREEIPHQLAVTVERWEEEGDLVRIDATIWVERESQKPIVIGQGGQLLKRVGSLARRELEQLLGKRVFLALWVKVKEKWSDREQLLRKLGYAD